MSDGFHFFDYIFLAMVAGFIALRLRGVLGRRTGNERPPPESSRRRYEVENKEDNVVSLDPHQDEARDPEAEGDTSVRGVIARIMVEDDKFSIDKFLVGAGAAYRMIVTAFADGDKQALQNLLNDQVFDDFETIIDKRDARGHTATVDIEGETEAEVAAVNFESGMAEITVKFVTHLVRVTRDEEGAVIDGHPTLAQEVTDIWVFRRNVRDGNPNWLLVSTRSAG